MRVYGVDFETDTQWLGKAINFIVYNATQDGFVSSVAPPERSDMNSEVITHGKFQMRKMRAGKFSRLEMVCE